MKHTNKLKMIFIESEKKWYEQTYFICLCFAFWFFLIPLIIGSISLLLFFIHNYKRNKDINSQSVQIESDKIIKSNVESIANNANIQTNTNNTTISNEDKKIILEELEKANTNSYIIQSSNSETSLYKRTKTQKFVDDYVIFDLETTGFYPDQNEIIEISALKYKNNILIDTFSTLVKPSIPIPKKITKLTGITDEDVSTSNTIDIILPQFISFIEDYTLIAHNGSFDFGFIENNLNKYHLDYLENPNIDTLYLARKYIPDLENHKLETLKEYFNLDNISHRATSDCETTNVVYQYCKNKELNTVIN